MMSMASEKRRHAATRLLTLRRWRPPRPNAATRRRWRAQSQNTPGGASPERYRYVGVTPPDERGGAELGRQTGHHMRTHGAKLTC
jgi:hypothetical protein